MRGKTTLGGIAHGCMSALGYAGLANYGLHHRRRLRDLDAQAIGPAVTRRSWYAVTLLSATAMAFMSRTPSSAESKRQSSRRRSHLRPISGVVPN